MFSSHHLDLVEGLCKDVVIIHRGASVLEGAVSALKAGARQRHVEIEVQDPTGPWLPEGEAFEVVERRGNRVRLTVDRDVDIEALLALARRAGTVSHFSFEPPRLSELFMEAVS
ncbi:MAG: ATP-binding cassette domain-containing protein [Dehalococcoidia bacterium]|nr:ATP-binding cassette domain-containing protein [Dehalococcoidia bacterium]